MVNPRAGSMAPVEICLWTSTEKLITNINHHKPIISRIALQSRILRHPMCIHVSYGRKIAVIWRFRPVTFGVIGFHPQRWPLLAGSGGIEKPLLAGSAWVNLDQLWLEWIVENMLLKPFGTVNLNKQFIDVHRLVPNWDAKRCKKNILSNGGSVHSHVVGNNNHQVQNTIEIQQPRQTRFGWQSSSGAKADFWFSPTFFSCGLSKRWWLIRGILPKQHGISGQGEFIHVLHMQFKSVDFEMANPIQDWTFWPNP